MITLDLIAFFTFYLIFFISSIGFGILLQKIINFTYQEQNYFIQSLLGLVFLTFFGYLSSFFIAHSIYFNLVIHIFGIYFFINKKKKIRIDKIDFLIFCIMFSALIISKNHDDFPYYHFQQILNLSSNKFQIGLVNLDMSYAHHSSLFFLNSMYIMPYFEYNFINIPNFLLFTNIMMMFFIFLKNEQLQFFIRTYAFFVIAFALLKFTRLSEFGSDVTGQLIMVFNIFLFLDSFLNKNKAISNLKLSLILILFCVTLKTYFIVYSILLFSYLCIFNFEKIKKIIKSSKNILIFCTFFLFLFFVINLLTSGCLIYPLNTLCFDNLLWAMPSDEVTKWKQWYEIWSKSLAGAGYTIENKEELLNDFKWLPIWYENYFITKVKDNILTLIFIFLIIFFNFYFVKKKNKNKIKLPFIFYLSLSVIFCLWFLKHPQLRYGGYAILIIIFAIMTSHLINKKILDKKKFLLRSYIVLFLCISFFVTKNFIRINSEIKRDDLYKFTNFPFFSVPDIKYRKHILNNNISVFSPINGYNCWNVPSPCPYHNSLRAKKAFGFVVFYKDK